MVFHLPESRFHFMGPLLHLTFYLASSLIRAECALFCDEPTLFHVPCFASFIAVFDRVHATTKSVSLLSLSRKGASPSAAAYTSSANHFSLRVNVPAPQARDRTMRDRDSFVDSDASIHRCTDSSNRFQCIVYNRCIWFKPMHWHRTNESV